MASIASLLATAGLALLALYVLAQGLGPLRPRRALTGLALLAAAGLILWAHFGSPVGRPRAAVIVFTDDTSPADLQTVAEALGPGDRVAWLRAGRAAAAETGPATWTSVAEALPFAQEPPEAYQRRLRQSAAAVSLEGQGWLERLIEADRTVRANFPLLSGEGHQHTLIVLHERGPIWSGLHPRGLDLAAAVAQLQGPATEVYLLPARAEDLPGWLELELEREVVPPLRVEALGAQRARVSLRGAESLRASRPTYSLELWLDGGPDTPKQPHHGLSLTFADPGPESSLLRQVSLAELEPRGGQAAEPLRQGLHRLHARLTVQPEQAGGVPLVYSASRYFLVDPRGLLLLHPGDLGALAQPTWPQPPPNPGELLKQFLRDKNRQGQRARAELSPESVLAHPLTADTTTLRAALESSSALVLVEPSHEHLLRLDRDLPLGQRLRDGLTMVVIGPPPFAEPWPRWLPCAALPVKGTQQSMEFLRDRRVYFCPENLRLLKFPARDRLTRDLTREDVTGLRAQRDVIEAVCKELGVKEPQVRIEDETGLEPRLTVPVPVTPWLGRFEREGREVPITLYPPVAPFLRQGASEGPAIHPEWETLAGFLPARLRPLEEADACLGASVVPLRERLQPGAAVVLFLDDLPQPVSLPEASRNALCSAIAPGTPWPAAPLDRECIARLARLGVMVYAVRLKLDPVYHKTLAPLIPNARTADDYLAGVRGNPALAPFLKEVPLELTPESVERVGKQLAQWIKDQPGGLIRQRGGRVIDERGQASRPAPERHRVLEALTKSKFDRPHATIEDARFPKDHPGRQSTAVQAFAVREGTVVVYGYSPFARDVWQSDAGAAGWNAERGKTYPPVDGWGVQRLLDAAELTTPRRATPGHYPVVRGARVAEDEATLWLDCWANLSGGPEAGWQEPTLHRRVGVPPLGGLPKSQDRLKAELQPAGPPQKVPAQVTLHGIDPQTQSVTFQVQYRGREPLRGWFALHLDTQTAGPAARPEIYLDLLPTTPRTRSVREALGQLAGLTGGTVLNHETAASALVFRRSASWLAGFLLTGLVLLLLSPLLRPWAILRRRRRPPATGADGRRAVSFDVQGVLVEWGFNPGAPQAARRAGDPAGQKPYEPGDSFVSARPATLLPFTSGGRVLPPRRPIVRQRIVGRAMEAVLLLDCTPGLFVPADVPSKADYVVLLARLLAGAVWATAGMVSIASVQHPGQIWGPRGAGDDSEDLVRFVSDLLAQGARRHPGRLVLPEEMGSGRVVFFVSDMLAPREAELPPLLEHCAREEISFRVVQVQGGHNQELVGMGISALSNRLLDRTEWTAQDMAFAQEQHAAELRALVEAHGGRFAAIPADLAVSDVFERLIQRDIVT